MDNHCKDAIYDSQCSVVRPYIYLPYVSPIFSKCSLYIEHYILT